MPIICQGQIALKVNNSTIRKFPDKTIYQNLQGPIGVYISELNIWVDTCWIGETGYLIPRFENPVFSSEAEVFWRELFREKLLNGVSLNFSADCGAVSGCISANDSLQAEANAQILTDFLRVHPFAEVSEENSGWIIYHPPGE
jgi:hypothetical protein